MNVQEQKVYDQLKREGWQVLTNGWPDFLAIKRKGRSLKIMCVEVKSFFGNGQRENLRPNQIEIHKILKELGICVKVEYVERVTTGRYGKFWRKPPRIVAEYTPRLLSSREWKEIGKRIKSQQTSS